VHTRSKPLETPSNTCNHTMLREKHERRRRRRRRRRKVYSG